MSFFSKIFNKRPGNAEQKPAAKGSQTAGQKTASLEFSKEMIGLIRSFVPLNELTDKGFQKALQIVQLQKIKKNTHLFRVGDEDDRTIYLISGTIELVSEDQKKKSLSADQDSALYPLSNLKPRRFNANTTSEVEIVEFPSEELERIIHWDQVANMPDETGYEVHDSSENETEMDSGVSWIFHMTKSPAIAQLPASNIGPLFKAFEAINVKSGQVIIEQGEPGDFYYVIAQGTCEYSRKDANGEIVRKDTMGEGDSFGEEALLSGLPRNGTVTMTSDGQLMRLSKDNFIHLLKEKILHWVEPADVLKAPWVFIDVRSESEFRKDGLKGSINLPLQDLRQTSKELDSEQKYLVYCDNGSRSASAAYLLTERGFDVCILKGGLAALSENDIS